MNVNSQGKPPLIIVSFLNYMKLAVMEQSNIHYSFDISFILGLSDSTGQYWALFEDSVKSVFKTVYSTIYIYIYI